MKALSRTLTATLLLALSLAGCKGEQRLAHYSELYTEQPAVAYVAPLNDISMRRAVREPADSAFNASLNTAAKYLYLTAADPLTNHGYYVPGPLASAQLASSESRSSKQLRNGDITDLKTSLNIDAVLFITLHSWQQTQNEWVVYVEYMLRSTHTGTELMHCWVKGTKMLQTDFKGNPKPLKADLDFAKTYGCDMATAQRCRLVETLNKYVLKDIPAGERTRSYDAVRYLKSHPEYFSVVIRPDGSVGLTQSADDNIEAGFTY